MRIIRMTMENELVERVDARVKRLGTTRSAFTRQALRNALRRLDEKELEERHVAGYRRDPAQPGEFEVPEADHAWGDDAWSADQSTVASTFAFPLPPCPPRPRDESWYFPMMKPRSRTGEAVVVAGAKPVQAATELPLSVIHAEALYRPVPPVEYDDEGYPGPDGNVPESTQHAHTSAYTFNSLRAVFRDRGDDLIAHDLMLLFEEGNRKATLAPDLMVVMGVGNEPRDSYKTWKEGKVPDLVIEVVSRSTWRKDVNVKPPLYEALGIAEFWLFDPLNPRLAGFELVRGRYREIAELPEGGLRSRVLALDLLVMDGELRCRDPRDAKVIPDHVETVRMLDVAERKLSQADHERAEADRQLAEADRELATSKREREQALRRVAELAALLRQARAES